MRGGRKKLLVAILIGLPVLLVAAYYLFPGLALSLAERIERGAAGLEAHEIEAAGHQIEYLSGGSGDALLLLHGFGADKTNWVRVAKHLTPHYHVIAPDLPGFGESSRDPDARYAIRDQVDRVHALAQALELESFHLGGNSMGGHLAGAYAARYPNEVKSLWLIAPGGVTSAKESELDALLAKGENPLLVSSTAGFERLLDFVFVERPFIPGPIKQYLTEQAIANRSFNEKILGDLMANPLPLESALGGLPVPALIVWGDSDRLLHVSGATILEAIMPNAKAVTMKNTGHIPMVERPEESAEHFLRFHGVKP